VAFDHTQAERITAQRQRTADKSGNVWNKSFVGRVQGVAPAAPFIRQETKTMNENGTLPIIGQPLNKTYCFLYVDVANQSLPEWTEIRADCTKKAIRAFAYTNAPTVRIDGKLWISPQGKIILVGVLPPHSVNVAEWGISRADWEAMLAETITP
jgi:hypothetical protein